MTTFLDAECMALVRAPRVPAQWPSRRGVLGATLMLPLLAGLCAPARADTSRSPDVVVFCDPTLRPVLRHLGTAYQTGGDAAVRLICAPAAIIAAQIARGERNDIVITLEPVVQEMAAAQLVNLAASDAWRNRITVAGLGAADRTSPETAPGVRPASTEPDWIAAALGDGMLGAPDPGGNAVFDTPALLRRLGLDRALARRLVGEVDTGGVAFLLQQGTVRLGLVLATDAVANRFTERFAVPDANYDPIRYAVARNRHAMSRNAAGFLAFLASAPAGDILAQSGLEIVA